VAKLRGGVVGALVLDAEGLAKLASGDLRARARFEGAKRYRGRIVTAASTLTEVIRGAHKDAELHRILKDVEVVAIDEHAGRAAGELLGRTGMSSQRDALDALLAVVAMAQARPVILLTSDPRGLGKLTEEPGRPKHERIAVVTV
jgi:predicted nucleic acid-binding protein